MSVVWEIFSEQLFFINRAYKIQIYAFVLMHNHFHLLPSSPQENLSEAMNWFMREVSRTISRHCGRINQTFGRPHHPSIITTDEYFLNAYRYIYRNPVEAGLVDRPEKYRYSTLPGLLGLNHLGFPVAADDVLFPDVKNTLAWLNTPYKDGERELIAKGLKQKTFEMPRDRTTRKRIAIEDDARMLPK
jgi:REP element-mobilizing transposase RayT